MKKVLIISYFFPPSNFVGAERIEAWTKYLHKNDIYPIVITRKWNEGQSELTDKVSGKHVVHEKFKHYEVYRLPYRYSLRDRCANSNIFKPFQKVFTLLELIFSNYFIAALPYSNFYRFSKKLLEKDRDIKTVIVSGRPFHSFFIGYKLKKKLNVNWIPDYRDEWNTYQRNYHSGIFNRVISRLEKKSELKWTKNASFFISVSEIWVDSIQKYIGINGVTIKNGYEKFRRESDKQEVDKEKLSIVYAGTLYPTQNIEIFMQACIGMISIGYTKLNVHFIGTNVVQSENERLKKLAIGFENNFQFTDRIDKSLLDKFMVEADLLYLTSFEGVKGWYPVKLFEYYSFRKPILLCPSDGNVMSDFIRDTGSGFIADSVEGCTEILKRSFEMKRAGEKLNMNINDTEGYKYSREYQTGLLGEKLRTLDL